MPKIDVVIPHNNSSYWGCNELGYCLRSLEKNFINLGDVYILGYAPEWVRNVIHIPMDDPYPKENKGANIISKILFACESITLSDNWLFCSDDQIMLKPMKSDEIKPYYVYDLKDFKFKNGNKLWIKCLKNTKKVLLKERLNCFNYETHTPKIINKKKFLAVMNKYNWKKTLYPTHSLYFNNVVKYPSKMPDNYRVFFNEEQADISLIKGKKFLGYNDLGLSYQLQCKLQELFPYKSKYEK